MNAQDLVQDSTPSRSLHHEALERAFQIQGYVTIPGVVSRTLLANLHQQLLAELERAKTAGELFTGGGTLSGHLNCFPGARSRAVYDSLEAHGVIALVQKLSARPLRLPNVGCNLNLPGSSAQNEHVDGYAATPFLVVNVAVVDTGLENGAMEVMPRTQQRDYKYWELLASRPERLRLRMSQGDVAIRTSTLWHRGMPNRTDQARPMLAFTWEDGGSALPDPFLAHDQIRFFPNRFRTDWAGRLRERVFITAPRLSRAARAARSLFGL
ncbi:MAG: phytanoyl-CoA dioxygenase family protein [Myxococcales bacterium]